jgi:DNA-binding NtrC family response regulator
MKHIMVIDDERDILTCLDEVLSAEGYRVTGVVSGAEALDLLPQDPPDLVMLDLRMPGMNGLEVLQAIRRTNRELPIVVCSALGSYKNDFEIISGNVAAFLDKPMDLDKVLETVASLVGEGEDAGVVSQPDAANG